MKKQNLKFTCLIWSIKPSNLTILKRAIKNQNGKFELIDSIDSLKNRSDILLIVEEDLLPEALFSDNELSIKIEDLEIFVLIIGTKRKFKYQPTLVKQIEDPLNTDSQIVTILDVFQIYSEKLNTREKALNKKLGRLFYIYQRLFEKETITSKEIQALTHVSKRTIQRDFQILREVLVTKTIVYDENEKSYSIQDIK